MPDWPDDRYPGKYLGRHEYIVDREAITAYSRATGDAHPWYSGDSPLGPVAPALLLHSEQYAFAIRDWYLPNLYGNLHIRQEWDLFRAVPVSSTLWSHGMIVDRYVRKDRDVVVLEFSVFTEGDVLAARGRCHQSFLLETPEARFPVSGTAGPSVVDRSSARIKARQPEPDVEPLEELRPVRRVADADLCAAFSGPGKNYHNDADEARKLGFPEIVVQGTMSTTFISEMLTHRFGMGWLEGGRMSLNLINVLWGGEAVSAGGVVTALTPEGSHGRAHLNVWTEKDDGTKTIAGTASAVWSPAPPSILRG